ncbi:rod shape-determining protein RodA [Desulfonatronovibrio magnus]|uniref:rod shape-determining protein RodA n=1 Tax=Desulfonatronovibrio magnus TaxID=698827 RepID=UPI0005EB4CA5|nr:rod shape-determining protein RodA [Desulfonatronovibrio magnus]RQD55519.1 MAG: rod shape-determining protein RodA [Desulfonatronovibrio sp. MSAO_Bac4]
MIDRQLFFYINWPMLAVLFLLFTAGVLNLYSASAFRVGDGMALTIFYQRQIIWGGISLVFMLAVMLFDYRHLKTVSWSVYMLALFFLVIVLFWGKSIYGAQRWIDLGIFNFQPSEFAKIGVLLMGAAFLARHKPPLGFKDLCKIMVIVLVPAYLITRQPDLGSALLLIFLICGMVLFHGIKKSLFKIILLTLPLIAPLGWMFLKDYQKTRLLSFLDPSQDPLGSGYHVIQSQIAVGSGGFWGKGFMEGTQSQLRFLPEKHTDFAFSVFGEEWGFIGAVALLSLFCFFLYQIFLCSQEAKDRFGSLLCAGVFFYFFWQILINIGMVLGLMPVVGIPLPFISYGGTSMLVNFIMIGLVLNVSMRRFMFKS